jgi:23S rRNA pseudouridine1911/1915/1917 synthase
MSSFEHRLSQSDQGRRADKVLQSHFKDFAYSHIRKLFRQSRVTLNGYPIEADQKVGSRGLLVIAEAKDKERGKLLPNRRLRLSVLYQDEHLMCLNKPSGLVMLPGPGHGSETIVAALLGLRPELGERFGREEDYGLVHRLDRGTSGVFIVPLNSAVRGQLLSLFENRQIEKRYLALVRGHVKEGQGHMTESLLAPGAGHRSGRVSDKGAEAQTEWVLKERLLSFTYLELRPKTGRTHQIRIHCAHRGHPVCGDRLYGQRPYACKRMLLHAASLKLKHPVTGQDLTVESPLPRDFRRKLKRFAERPFNFDEGLQGE